MTITVKFEHVSKKYRLGRTRVSLPTLVTEWAKAAMKRMPEQSMQPEDFWALHDVSFELRKGQSLALLGPNGTGKTTILKLLANITKATAGRIETNGQLSALIELGAGFHPDLTGRENIYLNGTILGLSRKELDHHFDEIVAFAELDRFIDTPVKRYSSGMQVRLGFAVASCMQPDILLVDEVLAVGDVSFQQKCMKRIEALLDRGTSIIFVSHNFYLVRAVCNTALYLKAGEVQYAGDIDEAIQLYEEDLHQQQARQTAAEAQTSTEEAVAVTIAPAVDETTAVKITKVEVWDVDGPATTPLASHQAAQIHIHYEAQVAFKQVHVSVFIKRSDGLTCCMMRTSLHDVHVSLQRGAGVITVCLDPLQLIGGAYIAEAWFLNDTDSMAITSQAGRSEWFTVRGAAMTYDNNSGVFEPKTRWELQTQQVPRVDEAAAKVQPSKLTPALYK